MGLALMVATRLWVGEWSSFRVIAAGPTT